MKSGTILFSRISATITALYLLAGCEIDGSDNLPRVPDQGLVMYAEANWHEAEDETQLAAGVYNDGVPINLVGGDVFEASTVTERVLLKFSGLYTGSYSASLPVDNSVRDVLFNIVHVPIEAREDRWYPVDLLNVDPGPGELVGKSATVSFPPAVTITDPADDTEYTGITDVIDLNWIVVEPGSSDSMRVLSAVECTDGVATSSYGTEVMIGADDGFEAISMDKFIFDSSLGSSTIEFLTDAALVLMQELLNKLSAGNIDPDFLARKAGANPIQSACEIRLFLQRQRQGTFDVAFDDGTVFGSRSTELAVQYRPPVIAR